MATSARYFDLVREMKDAYNHRLRMVEWVREMGTKPTARRFATSTLTVRKWWRRYQQQGPSGLQEHSRPYAPGGVALKCGLTPKLINIKFART